MRGGDDVIVYVVTFPNGKKYVGATTRALASRRSDHLAAAKSGVRNKFYNAIRKYGDASLKWKVAGKFPNTAEMFAAERALIAQLGTMRDGYNTTPGGEGNPGRVRDLVERAIISERQQQRFADPAARAATSAATKQWLAANPERARELAEKRAATLRSDGQRARASAKQKAYLESSPDAKQKMSEAANKLYRDRPEVKAKISRALGGKPIEVSRDGVVVATYPTLSECARQLSLRIGNIGMVMSGRRNHTGGYQFRRVENVA